MKEFCKRHTNDLNHYVRGLDIFGREVKLNLLREADTHNTLCGGYVSIICKILILIYVICSLSKLGSVP